MTHQTPTPEQIEKLRAQIVDFETSIGGDPDAGYAMNSGEVLDYLKELLERRLAAAPSRPVEGVTLADLAEHFWVERNRPHGPDSWYAGMVYAKAQIAAALAAPAPAERDAHEVDEAKLAEVIAEHKLVHVSVSRRSAFCRCNSSVTAGVDDNLAWFEQHRAHAVAEWLRGAR